MMGWGGYGGSGMMGYSNGFAFIGIIFWIVLFVDAVLLGVWLWKQINKK
ncbi:sporulation protein YjcZ [Candidatus Daviesbacteria bacterium]|nr:sporulation protein YjcZ [Candidatus Daviesbacteria bacterium]